MDFSDALYDGMTANAFRLGTVLSDGWFWMRRTECQVVYRRQDGSGPYYVQTITDSADTVFNLTEQVLPPDTIWEFMRRRIMPCGYNSPDSLSCIVKINSDGEMRPLTPNKPLSVVAEPLAGGIIKLQWRYTPDQQEITPTGFHIYIDSGAGFNFAVPDATVDYGLGGWGEFSWESHAYDHGSRRKFCVRSFTTNYGETQNTDFVSAIADAVGPEAVTGLTSEVEQL